MEGSSTESMPKALLNFLSKLHVRQVPLTAGQFLSAGLVAFTGEHTRLAESGHPQQPPPSRHFCLPQDAAGKLITSCASCEQRPPDKIACLLTFLEPAR